MIDDRNAVICFNGENNNIWVRRHTHTHTHTCAENKMKFSTLHIVWGLSIMVSTKWYSGVSRPPSSDISYFEQLETAIQQVVSKFKNNPNITYILGRDFNAGDIDWETGIVLPNPPPPPPPPPEKLIKEH